MASFSTVMDRCGMIKNAESMKALGILIEEYPELLFSALGMAELTKAIPRIIQSKDERVFDYYFINRVINQHRCRFMGGYKEEVNRNVADMPGGYANNDYPLHILKLYVYTLVNHTAGQCLEARALHTNYPFKQESMYPRSPYSYMGWLFLLPTYNDPNDKLWKYMQQYYMDNRDAMQCFISEFINATLSNSNPGMTAWMLARVWAENRGGDETTTQNDFIAKCRNLDCGWLDDRLRPMKDGHGEPVPEMAIDDCNDVFLLMTNIFTNSFTKENYFFEYLAEISYYYPLIRQRWDTAERYEKYFGDYAFTFMADFTTEVITQFSKLNDYKTRAAVKVVENQIHRSAEAIILEIRRLFPDTDPKVIELFFQDTCKAFGRGFNGAAPGCMCKIRPMIYEIFKKDKAVMESDMDFFDMIDALEGSYGDEDSDTKNDGGYDENSYESDPGLHRKAKTNTKDNMKSAERKIYNAYRKYKDTEDQVDETLNRGIGALKKAVVGDQQAIIIEGKKFSAIGFLKKAIATIAIFNYNKIAAILFIVVTSTMRKKANRAEKKKILLELEAELEMIEEKIQDASGDGNRQAKYDLMRTRNAYQNAIRRIKYGMGAEERQGMKDAERLRSTSNYNGYRG